MRRVLAFLLIVAATGGGAALVARAPRALSRLESFRVQHFELVGARYLTLDGAVAALGLPPAASVWDDPDAWERRLRAHPLVRDARIGRKLPSTLVLEVDERRPVAFVASPTLIPVDASGRDLPLDPSVHRLDLPLISPGGAPGDLRALAEEAARLTESAPTFLSAVSDLEMGEGGDLAARGSDLPVLFRLRPATPARRLREALQVLDDAAARYGSVPREIDLRYADQVVVRLGRAPVPETVLLPPAEAPDPSPAPSRSGEVTR